MNSRKDLEFINFWTTSTTNNKLDVLTPHKISIIILIQEYLNMKNTHLNTKNINLPSKYRRKFCMLLLKLIQYPDMSFHDLWSLLFSPKYEIHETHLYSFNYQISNIGIETLFNLQRSTEKLVEDNSNSGISQFGIVGLYIRRINVILDKMSFGELMGLHLNMKSYYNKGIRARAIGPDLTALDDSLETVEIKERDGNHSKWSIKQAELFVAQQSVLLQNNEPKAMCPKDMQDRLNEILEDNPLYTQAHFLSYMNSVRLRDFYNASDSLHRAFDRSAVKNLSFCDIKGFQFSSLNQAILHAQFNHRDEALASLKECIMLAQENGDRFCLQLAQSWLMFLDKNQVQLKEKCVANKTELSLVHSMSLGIQFVVKVAALSGFCPSKLFELLLKSDILNCQHSMMDLTANCFAQRAAIWTLYGKHSMASLYSQLLLNSNLRSLGKTYNGECICHSLCCLALWLSLQGEYNLSAIILQHARERFPRNPLAKYWLICDYYITSQQLILKCNWNEADTVCCKLYTLDKSLSILQRATMNIARKNLETAQDLLNILLSDDNTEPLTRVRALSLLSHTYMLEESIAPDVINILNKALTMSRQKYFDYESAIIDMNYGNVLLKMKMPHQALKSVKCGMEIILTNGGIYDRAKCMFLFVKCLIESSNDIDDKTNKINDTKDIIEEIIGQFKKLEAYTKIKDVYYYMANVYNDCNLINERNKIAYKFRMIDEEFPTSSEYFNVFI